MHTPCVPLAIKTIMIVLFEILALFRFKEIRSSWLTLNEIMIALIAKGAQGQSSTFAQQAWKCFVYVLIYDQYQVLFNHETKVII